MTRYRFGSNLDSKFYVRKQIFWAIGEFGRGFALEFMRKSNKKKIGIKKTQIIEYEGSYVIFCILIVCCCSAQEQPEHNCCEQ